jgi:hypothetical protein
MAQDTLDAQVVRYTLPHQLPRVIIFSSTVYVPSSRVLVDYSVNVLNDPTAKGYAEGRADQRWESVQQYGSVQETRVPTGLIQWAKDSDRILKDKKEMVGLVRKIALGEPYILGREAYGGLVCFDGSFRDASGHGHFDESIPSVFYVADKKIAFSLFPKPDGYEIQVGLGAVAYVGFTQQIKKIQNGEERTVQVPATLLEWMRKYEATLQRLSDSLNKHMKGELRESMALAQQRLCFS